MKKRIIAFYLPQYHPIPENDKWWGKGFTEWTNVGKAKPLFPGHYQPHVPSELGYYDLRVPETREAQASLAREYGIEGFCYWHYWFGNGKQLLERPFDEVLKSGTPDFPFCLGWANESWRGFYHGLGGRETLIEQTYPGEQDYINHFIALLPAFKDSRYIRVNRKPLLMIYNPFALPDSSGFISLWNRLAVENGLPGIHFVAHTYDASKVDELKQKGFDAVNVIRIFDYSKHVTFFDKLIQKIGSKAFHFPRIISYAKASSYFIGDESQRNDVYPTVIPNWDHSPRTGRNGVVFHGATPDLFKNHLLDVENHIKGKEEDTNLVFVKSWNEWAEGNYLEPDLKFGRGFLDAIKAFSKE